MPRMTEDGKFQMISEFVLVTMSAKVHAAATAEPAGRATWPIATMAEVQQWAAARGMVVGRPTEAKVDEEPKP